MHGGTGQGANRICPTSDPSEHAGECHSRWPCDNGNTESLQFWQMRLLGLREAKLPGQGHQREDWRLGPVGLTLFCVLPSTPCSSPCHCTVTHGRHTYVHTCRHTRVYTSTRRNTQAYAHTYTCNTRRRTYMCTRITQPHTCVCTCTDWHMYAHTCRCTHYARNTNAHKHADTQAHVCTHTRAHACTHPSLEPSSSGPVPSHRLSRLPRELPSPPPAHLDSQAAVPIMATSACFVSSTYGR